MTLAVHTDDHPIPVLGDAGEIEQVLLNLVVNGRDAAAGPGHRIDVSTTVDDGMARLTVHDTGTGMPPEVRDRAVEPFYSTKPKTEGTGLGLAIVYGIANRMGGTVDIDSTVGEGTTVTVTFPLAEDVSDDAGSGLETTRTSSTSGTGEFVLLVEDESSVRRATRRLLERAGHRVVDVADGDEAVALLDEGLRPTVLLTDLVLPGGRNGREVADHVVGLSPTTRVIFASGYPTEVLGRDGLAQSDASFLAKPFSSAALLDAVAGHDLLEATR